MNDIDKLLAKYESVKEQMLVMDDYDGGEYAFLRRAIQDLKHLQRVTKIPKR